MPVARPGCSLLSPAGPSFAQLSPLIQLFLSAQLSSLSPIVLSSAQLCSCSPAVPTSAQLSPPQPSCLHLSPAASADIPRWQTISLITLLAPSPQVVSHPSSWSSSAPALPPASTRPTFHTAAPSASVGCSPSLSSQPSCSHWLALLPDAGIASLSRA